MMYLFAFWENVLFECSIEKMIYDEWIFAKAYVIFLIYQIFVW